MIILFSGENDMPNDSDSKDLAKKKSNYIYSWPVPAARKPKIEQKKDRPSASNEKTGKLRNRIDRATV